MFYCCCYSDAQLCLTLCNLMDCNTLASLYFTIFLSFLKLMFIESVIPASVFPMNIQGWFPLGLTGLISLQSKGLSRVFYSTTIWKHQFFSAPLSLRPNSHIHTWLLEKTTASIDYKDLCQQSNVYLLIRLPMTSMLLNPMDTFECSFYLYQCGTQHRSWICLLSLWRNFMKYSWYIIQGFH